MSCPEKKTKLLDWVLGELPPAEVEEIQRHVEQCAACAHFLAGLRDTRQVLIKQFVDCEMPAHLVFVPEKASVTSRGFLASLWRTTTLAGAAAVVFLVIVLGGYRRWGQPPSRVPGAEPALMTRAEIEAVVQDAVRVQLAQQTQALETTNQRLAAEMRKEQALALTPVAAQLRYLQSAQSVVWKQTQEQSALVELIARNTLGQGSAQPSRP